MIIYIIIKKQIGYIKIRLQKYKEQRQLIKLIKIFGF